MRERIPKFGGRPVYLTVAKAFAGQQSMDGLNDPSSGETMMEVSITLKK